MSLREIALQNRVSALEEAVEALALTVRTHLPAANDMVESALSCLDNTGKHVEKTIAQTLNTDRVTKLAHRDRLLGVGELNELMKIYAPLLLMYDKDQRFFKMIKSNGAGPYSYAADSYELDLSQIPRNAYMAQPHVGGRPKYDVTRMTLHLNCRGTFGWYVSAISGTQLYQDEWVSYAANYDGETAPLFERELLDAIRELLRELDAEEAMIHPNFDLNGGNGVVHGLTLKHDLWQRDPKLLGEIIEGRGVILQLKNPVPDFDANLRVVLWSDPKDREIEIYVEPKHGENYKLIVLESTPEVIITTLGSGRSRLDPKDIPILSRARFRVLIDFVLSIMDESRTELSMRDPLGIIVDWEVSVIPYPEEA